MTNPTLDDARLSAAANPSAQFMPNTGNQRADQIFTANNVVVDPSVPTGLHPGSLADPTIVTPLMNAGREGEEILLSGTSWLKSAFESQAVMNSALKASLAPVAGPLGTSMAIPEHLKGELAQGFAQQFQKVSTRFEKQINQVATAVASLQTQIDAKLAAPNAGTTAFAMSTAGLGQYLLAMPSPGKRVEFMSQCIHDSDLTVIHAVLDRQFSSFNFGLSERERSMVRQMAEQKFAKPLCDARDAGAKVHGKLISACTAFTEIFKRQCPQPTVSRAVSAISALKKF